MAKKIFQHNLKELANYARLSAAIEQAGKVNATFQANWTQVSSWSEESRYETHTQKEAEEMVSTAQDPGHGVMQCIKQYW